MGLGYTFPSNFGFHTWPILPGETLNPGSLFFLGGGGLCGEKSMLQSIQVKVDSVICPYWILVVPWKVARVRQNIKKFPKWEGAQVLGWTQQFWSTRNQGETNSKVYVSLSCSICGFYFAAFCIQLIRLLLQLSIFDDYRKFIN